MDIPKQNWISNTSISMDVWIYVQACTCLCMHICLCLIRQSVFNNSAQLPIASGNIAAGRTKELVIINSVGVALAAAAVGLFRHGCLRRAEPFHCCILHSNHSVPREILSHALKCKCH